MKPLREDNQIFLARGAGGTWRHVMDHMDCGGTTPLWLHGWQIERLRTIAACS
jgi:hypothetical protein